MRKLEAPKLFRCLGKGGKRPINLAENSKHLNYSGALGKGEKANKFGRKLKAPKLFRCLGKGGKRPINLAENSKHLNLDKAIYSKFGRAQST